MKYLILIIVFCFFSLPGQSQKIATFKFALILENLQTYNDFMVLINEFKKKKFDELRTEEELLIVKKKDIEDSEIL